MTARVAATLLILLGALLSQGLTPHLHPSDEVGPHLHSQTQDCHEAAASVEAECVACRGGNKLRAASVTSNATSSHIEVVSMQGVPFVHPQSLTNRLLRTVSPPRAPPA